MRTVIVDRKDVEMRVGRSGLEIGEQHVPFRLVDLLVLGSGVTMGSETLLRLGRERIPVMMVDSMQRNFVLTLPRESHNGDLKLAQYRSFSEKRLQFAHYFLSGKFKTHATHLEEMGRPVELKSWQERLEACRTIESSMGVEGSFASLYFHHFFSLLPAKLHRGKRSKHPPKDPVNAVLSYLYTYMYNTITARLHFDGFDPSIGYLHEPFRSHHALSSDLLELFRALINAKVLSWFLEETLNVDDFHSRGGIYLKTEARKRLWPEIKALSDMLQPKIVEEIALLRSAIT